MITCKKGISLKIKQKLHSEKAMSIAEILMCVLILLLATSTMVAVISLASRQYLNSMRRSEAKVLCSTLTNIIVDEYSNASEIKMVGDDLVYTGGRYYTESKLCCDSNGHLIVQDMSSGSTKSSKVLADASYPNGLIANMTTKYENNSIVVELGILKGETDYATKKFQVVTSANFVTPTPTP